MYSTLFLFLIPIMTIWSGYPETGYQSHVVFISTGIEQDCHGTKHLGCVTDIGVIVENPFTFARQGCTALDHEWFHLMGYSEQAIPYCNNLPVPDYMREYLRNTP